MLRTLPLLLCLLFAAHPLSAGELRVAVAANFADALKELAHRFETDSGHKVLPIVGSTGKHYAQILHGAPFDAYFAADVRRPRLLDEQGRVVAGSRFTYAVGRLLLWSPKPALVDDAGKVLDTGDFRHLAIANPKLAPYGRAAQEVLQARGLWGGLRRKMVRGENIGQAYQFVKSGNAALGFVAASQVMRPGKAVEGSYWLVPDDAYSPIEQQAVLLKDSAIGRAFLRFVAGEKGRAIVRQFGYRLP